MLKILLYRYGIGVYTTSLAVWWDRERERERAIERGSERGGEERRGLKRSTGRGVDSNPIGGRIFSQCVGSMPS